MDPLVVVLTVVAAILSVVLIVVGVQTILVLQEVKRSLQRFNAMTEVVERTVNKALTPLQNVGGMMTGFKTGFKLLETFSTFLKRSSQEEYESEKDE
jgi:hypothetical protein